MAIFIIDSDRMGVPITSSNNTYYIEKGVEIFRPATLIGSAINIGTLQNESLIIRGRVESEVGSAITTGSGSDGHDILIGKTGFVTSTSNHAMSFFTDNITFNNQGTIKSESSNGTYISGDYAHISNGGKVLAASAGFLLSGIASDVENSGLIKANFGLSFNGLGTFSAVNTGRIIATTTGVVSASSKVFGNIDNFGMIKGDRGIWNTAAVLELYNEGTIKGVSGTAVQDGAGNAQIINAGRIIGDVQMGLGNDEFSAVDGGIVIGSVFGDSGEDKFTGGRQADRFFGGGDGDIFIGNGGNDFADGGAGDDNLSGYSGNDTLLGGDDDDNIEGGGGDDWIEGGDGGDEIIGGSGDDMIDGGEGGDVIEGGAGDDKIITGGGIDNVYGESGNDLIIAGADGVVDYFHYGDQNEGKDTIRGFEDGVDKLYLINYGINFSVTGSDIVNIAQRRNGDVLIDFSDIDASLNGSVRLKGMWGDFDTTDIII